MAIHPRVFPWLLPAALAAQHAATFLPSPASLRPTADLAAQRRAMEVPDLIVDEPGDGSVWARGRGYKAQIATTGLHFLAARGPAEALAVDFATVAVRVGNEPLPQSTPTLSCRPGNCQLDRGAFVENFALRPDGVEQSWVFASLPRREELTIDVAWSSSLPCLPDSDGHCFRAEDGSGVRYGRATAIDAGGKRLALLTQCVEDRLRIVVPESFVAMAELPLTVDPLVGSALIVASSNTVELDQPDLAFDDGTDSWLLVWNQQFSGPDWDVYARRLNRNLSPNGAAFGLELTSAIWRRPRVANLRTAAQFLVVAQNGTSAGTIVGRRVPAAGAALATQVIDASVNCSHPDVGGDPYSGSLARYNIVWSRSSVIQSVTMSATGALGTQRAVVATGFCGRPAISKGNREQRWLVAFTSISPGFDQVRVARINWNGDIIQDGANDSTFVATLSGTSSQPAVAVSSPNLDGRFLVAWEDNGDIWVRATQYAPVWLTPARNLQLLEGGGTGPAQIDRQPSVDTDGLRFAVAYAGNVGAAGSGNDDVFITTLALTTTDLRIDEGRVGVATLSSFSDDTPRVTSPFASRQASSTTLVEYGITYAYSLLSSLADGIEVRRYDGYAGHGGATGFTTFSNACGSPLNLTASGVPALGRTVDFALTPASPLNGFIVGRQAVIGLAAYCPCLLGVGLDGTIVSGSTLSLTIPNDVSFVGSIVACGGFTLASGPCFGTLSLSDTLNMWIR